MRSDSRLALPLICAALLLLALWFQPGTSIGSNAAAVSTPEDIQSPASQTSPQRQIREPHREESIPKTMVLEPFAATCRADVEARLNDPVPEVTFEQLPLSDVLTKLTELTGITIYFDEEEVGDVIDPDVPINVHVVAGSMSFKTLIRRFILEENDLVYVVRDRSLVIMSYDKSLVDSTEIVIYDCRDLLTGVPLRSSAVRNIDGFDQRYATPGGTAVAGGIPITSEVQLMQLIQYTIRDEDYPWDDGSYGYNGGGEHVGTMEGMHGLLIVQTIPTIHERIQQLLDCLRIAIKKQQQSATDYR